MPKSNHSWKLRVRDEFSSAHFLRHYQGKCEALHGHNFMVEVCVKGALLLPEVDLLLDFKDIKMALKKVIANIDHANLNALESFETRNPTSENLAYFIFQKMKEELAGMQSNPQVHMYEVTVSERSCQSATYTEE